MVYIDENAGVLKCFGLVRIDFHQVGEGAGFAASGVTPEGALSGPDHVAVSAAA